MVYYAQVAVIVVGGDRLACVELTAFHTPDDESYVYMYRTWLNNMHQETDPQCYGLSDGSEYVDILHTAPLLMEISGEELKQWTTDVDVLPSTVFDRLCTILDALGILGMEPEEQRARKRQIPTRRVHAVHDLIRRYSIQKDVTPEEQSLLEKSVHAAGKLGADVIAKEEKININTPTNSLGLSEDLVVQPKDQLTRPNGQTYLARSVNVGVDGVSDITLLRAARANGENIALIGPPGTGKTAALEVAFPGMEIVVCSVDTEAPDLFGSYYPVVGDDGRETLVWRDGPATRAAMTGNVLLLDEVSMVSPNQLTSMYALMDGRKSFEVPTNPALGRMAVADGFVVAAAWNPHAPGSRISEALLSRFGMIAQFTTDYSAMIKMGVPPLAVKMSQILAKKRDAQQLSWAPEARELLRFKGDMERVGLVYALNNMLNTAPETAQAVVRQHMVETFASHVHADAKSVQPLTI